MRTTPGTDGTLGYNYIAKDDDVWVYTGVTSATADNSIIGFVLVNQRTQESHFYSVSGATEDSAMQSAEGQVQNLRYTSTFPLLINVSNQPTYFMALKDGAGLVKKFAMIDIQRYQNVAVGDTVADTQKAYEGAARHQRRGGRGRGRRDRCGDGEGHHPLHESGGHRGQHPLLPDRGRGGRLHLRISRCRGCWTSSAIRWATRSTSPTWKLPVPT